MYSEFKAFLAKNNVMALAVAFIMGAAVGKLVSALVNDLIMPVVGAVLPSGDWRQITSQIGNAKFLLGDFAGTVLDFAIISFVVFLIGKALIKPAPTPDTKTCPACQEVIAAKATRCKYCTETLAKGAMA
jgi:large conductance mechanosensitive channel